MSVACNCYLYQYCYSVSEAMGYMWLLLQYIRGYGLYVACGGYGLSVAFIVMKCNRGYEFSLVLYVDSKVLFLQ